MKKTILAVLLLGLIAGCSYPQATISPSDSQTQIALFAEATLTKAAVEAQSQQTSTATAAEPAATETSAAETATSVSPTATPTAAPATSVPTVAVTPIQSQSSSAATAVPGQVTRLSFASGATNISYDGQLSANTTKRFVFTADKSQLMDISLSSGSSAYIAVTSPSGKQLVSFDQGWTWYRDYISEKGDWYIDVKTGSYDTSYSLYLAIPQRLSFAANTSSLTAKATVPAGRVHNFIAWGNKGQTIKVSVEPGTNYKISIWSVSGTVLLSGMGDFSSYEGVLPEAGDYFINVTSSAASSGEVTLSLSIK